MLSPLSSNRLSKIDFETNTSTDYSNVKRQSVKEKVHFYEQLSLNSRDVINHKSRVNLKSFKVTIGGTTDDKENQSQNINEIKSQSLSTKAFTKISNDKIQTKKRREIETEVSCSFDFQEKPVEFVKEEKEKRIQKIEILEKRVKSVRNQHRDSLKRGDVEKAENLFKKLQTMESRLAKHQTSFTNETTKNVKKEEIENVTEIENNDVIIEENFSSLVDDESSEFEFNENNINGDLWGIVPIMAEKYCVDEESTWRTFSSYSVNVNDDHAELILDSNSSLHADIFPNSLEDYFDDDGNCILSKKEEIEYKNFADRSNLKVFTELEAKYKNVQSDLQKTRLELVAFRAKLYESLHQLAKTEYQMRIYQVQLSESQTSNLEMEKEIERQKFILNDYEKQELEREIKQLQEETKLRKKQIEDLRSQIKNSISVLPIDEQTDLMVEDPFIECSVRILNNNRTPIQRISVLETKLSTLISQSDIRIKKKSKFFIFFLYLNKFN